MPVSAPEAVMSANFPPAASRTARAAASGRRHRRQRERAHQARVIVLHDELAAMQARDGGGETQAEPGARLRAALLEPHEALEHPPAIGRRNAGAVVGDAEQD